MESTDASGVYPETTGDPPTFAGIVSGSRRVPPTMTVRLYGRLPGFLVTDRPGELADAIQMTRRRR